MNPGSPEVTIHMASSIDFPDEVTATGKFVLRD